MAYPGIPATAKNYWSTYGVAVVTLTLVTVFAGSFAALVVSLVAPEAVVYFAVAVVGLVLHLAAMYVHDLWQGEYDPKDGGERDGPQTLAVVVIVGTLFSGLLLIGTALAFAVELLTDWPVFVSLAVAAYYPVVDTVLARRGLPSPGSLLFTGIVRVAIELFGITSSVRDQVPVVGQRITRRRSLR